MLSEHGSQAGKAARQGEGTWASGEGGGRTRNFRRALKVLSRPAAPDSGTDMPSASSPSILSHGCSKIMRIVNRRLGSGTRILRIRSFAVAAQGGGRGRGRPSESCVAAARRRQRAQGVASRVPCHSLVGVTHALRRSPPTPSPGN